MKLSVSLPDEDVEFLDRYAAEHGVATRSAVVQDAVALLRANALGNDYTAAWDEWAESDAEAWDGTAADGLAG